MKLKIEPIYFCTRSFIYTCSFKKMIKHCTVSAEDLGCNSNLLIDCFLNKYFNEEISAGNQIHKYHKEDKIEDLYKNQFILFQFNIARINAYSKNFKHKFLKLHINKVFNLFDFIIKDFKKYPANKTYKNLVVDIKELKQFYETKTSKLDDATKFCKKLHNKAEQWKEIVNRNSAKSDNNIYKNLKSVLKIEKDIDALFDTNALNNDKTKILLLLSQSGVLTISVISCVKDYSISLSNNDKINKKLAIKNTASINSFMNKLPKLFSSVDFNHFLGFDNTKTIIYKNIFDKFEKDEETYQTLSHKDKEEYLIFKNAKQFKYVSSMNKQIKTLKCLYLNIYGKRINNNANLMKRYNFYNYLSLLLGIGHSYDPDSILKFDDKKAEEFDLLKQCTQHLYFDDGQFTYTVINPSDQADELKNELNLRKHLMKNTSHKNRIYSFWDFQYICECGTYAVFLSYIKILYVEYNRQHGNKRKKQKLISFLSSEIERNFSPIFYYFKNNNSLTKIVLEKLNVDNISEDLENINKFSWREANFSNARTNYYVNIGLTTASLVITLLGFGMISKIFIDGYAIDYNNFYNKPPRSAEGLLYDIFTTPKFYLISAVTVFIILLIYAWYKIKYFIIKCKAKNLVALLKIKPILLNNRKICNDTSRPVVSKMEEN